MKRLVPFALAAALLATACGQEPVPGDQVQPPVEDVPVEVPDTTAIEEQEVTADRAIATFWSAMPEARSRDRENPEEAQY